MHKLTFRDGKTVSLQRLNNQFTLAEPALTPEAHAALCLFLPNENLADNTQAPKKELALCSEVKIPNGSYGYVSSVVVRFDQREAEVTLYGGDVCGRWPAHDLQATGEKAEVKFHIGSKVALSTGETGKLLWLNSNNASCVELEGGRKVDYPTKHLTLAKDKLEVASYLTDQLKPEIKPDDTVLVYGDGENMRATVAKVVPGTVYAYVYHADTGGKELAFRPEDVIKVLPSEEIDLGDLKQGDKLRVISIPVTAQSKSALKLGEVITFYTWMSNPNYLKISEGLVFHRQHFQKA